MKSLLSLEGEVKRLNTKLQALHFQNPYYFDQEIYLFIYCLHNFIEISAA